MSIIFALETSSNACSVAISTPTGVFEDTVVLPREHTQRLLPMVNDLLNTQAIKLNDIDAIAYGAGPGSFTGLRICLSVAQGLAFGADLPLVPVSSLLALAKTTQRVQSVEVGSIIVPVIDARMDEIYWCAYQMGVDGALFALVDEKVTSPEECGAFVNTLGSVPICTVGNGWQYPVLSSLSQNPNVDAYASAFDVALLGQEKFQAGQVVNPLEAEPVYLRNEVSWKKRKRIRDID